MTTISFFSEHRTIRDWFAGQALTGLAESLKYPRGYDRQAFNRRNASTEARNAYMLADAMLIEREKGGQKK